MSKQIDVLSVGDVVIDDFIKLIDEDERIEKKDGQQWLSIPFGTKVPFESSQRIPAVGNASNASVCLAKLGLHSGLVSNIGSDDYGRQILKALHEAEVDARFVHINHGKLSNFHYVLWYKDERTILIKHQEYDYHWPRFRVIDVPKWIYFSSISEHAIKYHDQLADWLEANPEVKLAFQPGTFQIAAGVSRLKRIYARTELLSVNRQEAAQISGGSHHDIHDLMDHLHELGPKIVVISDGHAGAYASDSQRRYKMPIYPDPKPPFERTGAGDAFTSTFVAAMARGADIQGALLWAPINAMSVVQKVGAQAGLLSEKEIDHFLRQAPHNYHPVRLA